MTILTFSPSRPRPFGRPKTASFVRLAERIDLWFSRAQSRRQLASLGERELGDIGISPSQAWHESRKPFWTA